MLLSKMVKDVRSDTLFLYALVSREYSSVKEISNILNHPLRLFTNIFQELTQASITRSYRVFNEGISLVRIANDLFNDNVFCYPKYEKLRRSI